MSAIQVNFKSGSQAGGTGGDPIQTAEYDSITAALAGVSGSFLVINSGVREGGSVPAQAVPVDSIAGIVLISAVTFGTVAGD